MDFKEWHESIVMELETINELLQTEFSENVIDLEKHMKKLSVENARAVVLYCRVEKYLTIARKKNLLMKSKALSETDRNIIMEDAIKEETEVCMLLKLWCSKDGVIAKKISTAQSLLAMHREIYSKT